MLTLDTGWCWEGKAAPVQLPGPTWPSAFMHIPALRRHGAGGSEAKDVPGDGRTLREVLDQGLMLLQCRAPRRSFEVWRRRRAGGEEDGQLGVLQPPLPLAAHVSG